MTRVPSMSMTVHPASRLAATSSPASVRFHTCFRILARESVVDQFGGHVTGQPRVPSHSSRRSRPAKRQLRETLKSRTVSAIMSIPNCPALGDLGTIRYGHGQSPSTTFRSMAAARNARPQIAYCDQQGRSGHGRQNVAV